MKLIYIILLYIMFGLCRIELIQAQKANVSFNVEHILINAKIDENDHLDYDTIRYKNSFMLLPRGINDKLIIVLRRYLLKDYKELRNLTNDGYNIESLLELKSYAKSSFISVVQKKYYENPYLHNISFTTNCYNFCIYNGIIYEILLRLDKKLKNNIDSIVKRTFDKDCLLNEELSNRYQIFFIKGKQYINNPLNSRVCDDSLYVPDVQNRIYLVKIKQ